MTESAPILVVDDDAVSRHVLGSALKGASFAAVFVGSGKEALAFCEREGPSLVLLDLVMPPPDGYEVLKTLRAQPRTRDVPIVVLTAVDADDEIARAFEAGADDFLRKPFRPAELIARIRGQLRLRQYMEAIEQKERDAQVVLELTQALASALDIRDILRTVVRRMAEVTRVDRCSIVLVSQTEGATERGFVVATNDDQQLRDLPVDLSKYPEITEVLRSGRPLVIADAAQHPLFEDVRDSHAYATVALLPIVFENRPLGVLFLRSRARANLDEHVVSLARTIANTTAIALRNARILQTLRDQTEEISMARVEAERRLRVTQRYADFFESAADGIAVLDTSGNLIFSNPRAREITGLADLELHGRRLADLVVAEDRELVASIRGVEDAVHPRGVDLRIERPDGARVTINATSSVLRDDQAILITFRDVTNERATENELRRTKGFLESVINSSADAIVSADLRGNVLLFNRAAERCYGYSVADVVGKMSVEALYPEGLARDIMRRVRQSGGRIEGFRTEVVNKDGERVPVSLSAALIHEGGKVVGSVGIFTDLRERIRMETKLVAAQEELKMREKQALIAELAGAAAHELNQPLTSVMGYAELLKRRLSADSPASSAAEIIFNEAERMAEIVRKIGKITRYETKSYVGHAKILDLDRASGDEDEPAPRRGS